MLTVLTYLKPDQPVDFPVTINGELQLIHFEAEPVYLEDDELSALRKHPDFVSYIKNSWIKLDKGSQIQPDQLEKVQPEAAIQSIFECDSISNLIETADKATRKDIQDAVIERCNAIDEILAAIRNKIAQGMPKADADNLLSLPVDQAVKAIHDCTDKDQLTTWLKSENRKTVKPVIESQIKELING